MACPATFQPPQQIHIPESNEMTFTDHLDISLPHEIVNIHTDHPFKMLLIDARVIIISSDLKAEKITLFCQRLIFAKGSSIISDLIKLFSPSLSEGNCKPTNTTPNNYWHPIPNNTKKNEIIDQFRWEIIKQTQKQETIPTSSINTLLMAANCTQRT